MKGFHKQCHYISTPWLTYVSKQYETIWRP